MTPLQVSELIDCIEGGELIDRLSVVSRDRAFIAAIDEALTDQPDVLEKIRDGKVRAAGAVIGAAMKATNGGRMRCGCAIWCLSERKTMADLSGNDRGLINTMRWFAALLRRKA